MKWIRPRKWAWEYIIFALGLILFAALNIGYATWDVHASQHSFCQIITTINKADSVAPKEGNSTTTPGRVYEVQLVKEFQALQRSLGC